jgi:hypothetical protein
MTNVGISVRIPGDFPSGVWRKRVVSGKMEVRLEEKKGIQLYQPTIVTHGLVSELLSLDTSYVNLTIQHDLGQSNKNNVSPDTTLGGSQLQHYLERSLCDPFTTLAWRVYKLHGGFDVRPLVAPLDLELEQIALEHSGVTYWP